jgi:hypothetical protein
MEYKTSFFQLRRTQVALGVFAALAATIVIATTNWAFAATTVQIGTVNGQSSPFNYSCPTNPLTNPVTLTGSGTGEAPPGLIEQYKVQVDWGDGTQSNGLGTSTPASGQGAFSFTFQSPEHTYATSGPHIIKVRVYHQNPPGNDNQADQTTSLTVCVGTTTPATGTLVVQKQVVNNSGGSASSSAFAINVKNATSGAHVAGSPAAGNASGTVYTLPVGNYIVSEATSTAYTGSFSGACNASGAVTVSSGATSTCVLTNDDNVPPPGPAPDVTVTIAKYINGSHATSSTGTSTFSMSSTWNSTSTGSGSGTFSLGPVGFNNPNPYEATTATMTSGASYSLSENTASTTSTGLSCSTGQPFRLIGYSVGDSLSQAASSTVATTSVALSNITTNTFIVVWNETCAPATTTPPTATSSQVFITKYLNGMQATASSSNSFEFPMFASWMSANLNGGATTTGTYVLGPSSYMAQTSLMSTSSNFATNEVTSTSTGSVLPIGAACEPGKYRLLGYSNATSSFAAAASSTLSSTSPSFFNLTGTQYVVVWNEICAGTTTPPTATSTVKVHILKYLGGAPATASSSNNFQFSMTATWKASNLDGGATTTGSYVLGNSHGGASQQYGADTSAMSTSSNYTTSEVTATSTGIILPIGAACEPGKYRLLGYSTSPNSFAAAASSTISSSSPTFWNLNADQYVIVWNEKCSDGGQNPPPTPGTCPATTPQGYTRVNGTVRNDTVTLQPNTMYVDPAGNDKISGPNGNYIICSGSGNDVIKLGNGDVQIYSGTGNDEITVGDGSGSIFTDSGNDTVITGNGNHTVVTGVGNDTVMTGSGVDMIDVGNGNNTVEAGGGNDSITAGNGNDDIDGGAGVDTCSPGIGNNEVVNCEL